MIFRIFIKLPVDEIQNQNKSTKKRRSVKIRVIFRIFNILPVDEDTLLRYLRDHGVAFDGISTNRVIFWICLRGPLRETQYSILTSLLPFINFTNVATMYLYQVCSLSRKEHYNYLFFILCRVFFYRKATQTHKKLNWPENCHLWKHFARPSNQLKFFKFLDMFYFVLKYNIIKKIQFVTFLVAKIGFWIRYI